MKELDDIISTEQVELKKLAKSSSKLKDKVSAHTKLQTLKSHF
jgi:hypothetical protein